MVFLRSLALVCLGAIALVGANDEDDQYVFRQDKSSDYGMSRRLVKWSENEPAQWLTEWQVETLVRHSQPFMDITDYQEDEEKPVVATQIPKEPAYQDEVAPFLELLDPESMRMVLDKFTSFHTRYYKSSWGAKSCRWLAAKVREIAAIAGDRITVAEFNHPWSQFSIIARFEGSNDKVANETVIVGAHQDSMNMWLPAFGRSPGADDDGSGTVTILEAFRSLVQNGFIPERPVEFHWYSAEEGGLLGSQAVAKAYSQEGIHVVGMLQNDMTGYVGPHEEVIGLVTDYVNDELTEFLKKLIDTYVDIPYAETECGYACSDHASWRKYGYPSGFVIESTFEDSNQFIHTSSDTADKLSFEHMKEFAKLVVAFAIELSHVRAD